MGWVLASIALRQRGIARAACATCNAHTCNCTPPHGGPSARAARRELRTSCSAAQRTPAAQRSASGGASLSAVTKRNSSSAAVISTYLSQIRFTRECRRSATGALKTRHARTHTLRHRRSECSLWSCAGGMGGSVRRRTSSRTGGSAGAARARAMQGRLGGRRMRRDGERHEQHRRLDVHDRVAVSQVEEKPVIPAACLPRACRVPAACHTLTAATAK